MSNTWWYTLHSIKQASKVPQIKAVRGFPFPNRASERQSVAKQEEKAEFSCMLHCKPALWFWVYRVIIIIMSQHNGWLLPETLSNLPQLPNILFAIRWGKILYWKVSVRFVETCSVQPSWGLLVCYCWQFSTLFLKENMLLDAPVVTQRNK